MATLSPGDARAQIADLIGDSVYQALGLKEALEDERRALETQDLDGLEAVVASKSACTERLRTLDQQRIDLCKRLGFDTAPHQMTEVIDWCDADGIISDRWEQLLVLAAEGSALNMTNGAIIRVRQQQFESSLSILRGGTRGAGTYGQNGEDTGDFDRRSLAEA